jgi:hypothetical protein
VLVASPVAAARYQQGAIVPTSFSCSSDVGITGCTGPDYVDTAVVGNRSQTFTATDQFGLTTSMTVPYVVDGTPPQLTFGSGPPVLSSDGSATFTFSGVDPDDPGYAVRFTCQLDDQPAVPCTSPHTAVVPAPIEGHHSFTVVGSDRVGNSGSASYSWDIDTTAPLFNAFIGPADPTSQTTATFAYSTDGPVTVVCTLDGTAQPCSPTGATITGLTARVAPYVFRVTATDGAGNTATREHSWHVYAETKVVATGVLAGVPNLKATLTTVAGGAPLAGKTLVFRRGMDGSGPIIPCAAVTNSSGMGTCNISLTELAAVALSGYTAVFAPVPPYFGSQGSAGLLT